MNYLIMSLLISASSLGCAQKAGIGTIEKSRYIITAEEIAESSANTAFEAVQFLRPELLNRDTRRSITFETGGPVEAWVYVDNARIGRKDRLKDITAREIAKIEYIPSRDAGAKYGSGHAGGVFSITTE